MQKKTRVETRKVENRRKNKTRKMIFK